MVKGVLICIVLLLAISGLCDIIHNIRSWVLSSKKPRNTISVVYLREDSAFSQLKYIAEQHHWYGTDFAEYYIAITDELSYKEIENYENNFAKYGFIFCPSAVVSNVLKSLMKGN